VGQSTYNLANLVSSVYRFVLICLGFAILADAPSAAAQNHISKVSIDNLVENNTTTLDWKTNEIMIPFDLPETVWIDHVEFLVSAQPTGQLRQHRNLQLRLNGSEPIILKAQGQRFDARIRLETKHLRRRGNRLYLSGIATSPTCPSPNSAGWDISQDRSMLVFYGRNMTRDMNLRDLNAVWSQNHNAQAPNIGLKVIGTESFRHESLIMQAVALRTSTIPKINTVFSGNKIDIIAGLRRDVSTYIRSEKGQGGTGAQVIIDEKRPPRLIITGDTEEELRAAVNAFARHKLPLTRRTFTTANEISLQPPLSSNRQEFNKTHPLSDAGVLTTGNSWLTPAQSFSFDTSYAAQRTGSLILKVNASEKIAQDSILYVTLNGRKLGQTQLDVQRKTVRFDIPEGYLIGSNNKIKIQPDLKPSADLDICSVSETTPQFSLGLGSKITLSSPPNEDIHDLSNFAALSGPFAQSDSFLVYGTGRNGSEKRASLQLMGRLALISGQAWIEAEYITGKTPLIPSTGNILIIGPKTSKMEDILANAPKALRLALNGKKIPAIEDDKVASILKVAALDEQQAFKLAAASTSRAASSYTSGLIALYDDQTSQRTIGVITTRPGASFAAAASNLLKPTLWNSLQGSVAQWDESGTNMLQIAQPKYLASSRNASSLKGFGAFNWDKIELVNPDWSDNLKDFWSVSAQSVSEKTAAIWESVNIRWNDIFNPSNSKPEEAPNLSLTRNKNIDGQSTNDIPVPIIKPQPRSKTTRATAKSVPLRGAYDPENFKNRQSNPIIKPKIFNDVKSMASNSLESIKTLGSRAYGDFQAWGNQINSQRQSSGKRPLVPTPILALLCLVFLSLILLSIASPHQRRY